MTDTILLRRVAARAFELGYEVGLGGHEEPQIDTPEYYKARAVMAERAISEATKELEAERKP